MSDEFDTERMCRLNGMSPTSRERWTAFYRLWRIAHNHGAYQDMAADDCFRILLANWSWLFLADARDKGDCMVNTSKVPMFLRRRLLEGRRSKRLYGQNPQWRDDDRRASARARDQGVEVTPLEFGEVRSKVLRLIRERAARDGVAMPVDDRALWEWFIKGT